MVKQLPLTPSRNKLRLQPQQYYPILWFLKLNHGETQAAKDQNGNSYKFALRFIDDMVVITTPDKIQQTINETIALYKEMHLEVNTEKCECTHPNFFNKSGIVNFLGQYFGKTAKPLAKQITDNLKKKFDGYAKLDIPNKDKLLLFCQCIVITPVITDLSSTSRSTALRTSSFIKKLTSSQWQTWKKYSTQMHPLMHSNNSHLTSNAKEVLESSYPARTTIR
ncbi:DNA/RNA_polymerase superfamily [Hexamita inflata]|uniref:DNA/RNA polymerase superfamily n=1 Tax=Hexamita inflata TaxID=28002 RepID=A0AA86Q1W7_9EUKA|nr:DNA/RNA polymerase superfamily [Hexamita inflata]